MSAPLTLWWRHGTLASPLAGCLDQLIATLGSKPALSYLEWRPGAGLLNPLTAPPQVLIDGPPDHDPNVPLDELRLFAKTSGLHAIEDAGSTRWMQWMLGNPTGDGWEAIDVEAIAAYPILRLDKDGARRFGLSADRLPRKGKYTVREYRHNGELFCWNLHLENANG